MVDFTINKDIHINFIMDNFDFEKIHKAMVALDWEWFGITSGVPTCGIPTIEDLKSQASDMLYYICSSMFDSSSSGGLKVTKHEDHLELDFSIGEMCSSILNNGEEYDRLKLLKERRKKIDNINK